MQESTRKIYDGQRNFSNKSFRSGCYAPFVSLYFNTLGDVVACCKNQTFVLGNVSRNGSTTFGEVARSAAASSPCKL